MLTLGGQMNINFYVTCFIVGVSVSVAVGPIFILTFNRSACYGFSRGFATALGAACGDGFLFFLGLLGVLKLLERSAWTMLAMDLLGGVFLISLGVHSFKKRKKIVPETQTERLPPISTVMKTFLLSVANPLSVLYFMLIGVRFFPHEGGVLPLRQIIMGSALVSSGSLTVLSLVAYTASHLGRSISDHYLRKISFVTGCIFIGIGCYFFHNFVVRFSKMFV